MVKEVELPRCNEVCVCMTAHANVSMHVRIYACMQTHACECPKRMRAILEGCEVGKGLDAVRSGEKPL